VGTLEGNSTLYRPDDVARLARDLPVIERVAKWCNEFLARPNSELGRTGSVCPFIPRSLVMNRVAFVVVRTQNSSEAEIDRTIAKYRDVFLSMEPVSGPGAMDKAIIVILPDVSDEDAPAMVDETHRRLKAQFVDAGLMIGKFHPLSEQGGLHNPGFRPLRSPIPMLAIRNMVDSDLPFLNRVDDPIPDRVKFLEAYERRFEGAEESRWYERGQVALSEVRVPPEEER
jgi:hypothetical protein